MISFFIYKRFEKKILRELEDTNQFRLMMATTISPDSYGDVFVAHAGKLSIGYIQRANLAEKLTNLVDKTDLKTIAMLYAYFLWLFVYDNGKTRKISNEDDLLRENRIEYGLNNFNLVEKHGFYTFATIDYKKYNEYLKNN